MWCEKKSLKCFGNYFKFSQFSNITLIKIPLMEFLGWKFSTENSERAKERSAL